MNKSLIAISGLLILACAGCSSSVNGTIESVEIKSAFFQSGNVAVSEQFISVTILSQEGRHYAALPQGVTHDIRPGDVITAKLGRTVHKTTLPAHTTIERSGMMRIVADSDLEWKQLEEYRKIP